MGTVTIRNASLSDAEAILTIYAYYVTDTAISFEYTVPSLAEFRRRMERTMERYPYLVAQQDGRILGYCYAGPFVGRAAYGWGAELTVYLDKDAKKCGLGRALYAAMEKRLKAMGVVTMYACIGITDREDPYIDTNSADFHGHMGFRQAACFQGCGYKFGRWYDMIWMEKRIAPCSHPQPPLIPYPMLKEEF